MADKPPMPQSKPATDSTAGDVRAEKPTDDDAPKKQRGRDISGTTVGDFQLLRKLGSGGMGEVYLAQQVSLKRSVALKVLRPDATDLNALKRFTVEAEAAAKLTHANIVQIYSSGQADGTNFMALEYVQGMNLRDFVAKKGPLTAKFAIKLMEQVAAALHHAGEAGVVHRDIKPDNIMLTRRGEVKVADFGLARLRVGKPTDLTQTGVTMGTPLYMSPEQVEGKQLDSRSDLYSFGVTCYYMLTGRPPYQGETALAVAVQHIKGEPPPLAQLRPDLPPEFGRIVEKLMAKDPDQRYQTGRQVQRDLQKLRGDLAPTEADDEKISESAAASLRLAVETTEKRDSWWRRAFRPEAMRRNLVWWFAACLFVAASAGLGYGWFQRAPDLRPHAADFKVEPPPIPWQQVQLEKTPREQYDYALLVGQHENAEAAWMAVINHPEYEPEWQRRAWMQLGKHYLDERQLDKAEKLYTELAASPDLATRLIGEIGKAAVLSLQDRPQESLESLWRVVKERDSQVRRDRMLLGMVFWTFERNYRSLGQAWDKEIRRWADERLRDLRANQAEGGRPGGS